MDYSTPPWWRRLLYWSGANRLLHLQWWISIFPIWLYPSFWFAVLGFPFRWFLGAWHERRLKHFLLGLPALTCLFAGGFLIHRIRQVDTTIANTYWDRAQQAILAKDYARAEMLLDRILQEDKARVEDARYALAVVFEETGNTERAEALFNALAPDDRRGFRDAHKRLSLILSDTINDQSTETELNRLKWHLDASADEESARMAVAWGRYSVAIGDLESARRFLEIAAVEFPELWATLGQVHSQLGNSELALASYEKAAAYLSGEMASRPDDRMVRVDYALVLMRSLKLDEARGVLEEGLRRDPEGQWKQLLAALYVNYHDLLIAQGGHPISELLMPIGKSLENEPNFGPALNRLMGYASANVEGNVELKSVLARVVAEGKEPALAHLALGNVCWMEGDKDGAVFHFERALRINDKLSVVMNNLAWLISHEEKNPDLDRAMGLITSALEKEPANGSFLDTRGTIYLMQQKYVEALDDFEKAARTVRDKAAIQKKLADVNEKLGRKEMAEQHRILQAEFEQAQAAATNTKAPDKALEQRPE